MEALIRSEILKVLKKINISLRNRESADGSLFGGNAGILLYQYNYVINFGSDTAFAQFESDMQNLADNSILIGSPTFCRGQAGVDWFFSYLVQKGSLEKEFVDNLIADEDKLAAASLKLLRNGNYDYLHGALGILHYLLFRSYADNRYYDVFFAELNNLIQESPTQSVLPNFNFSTMRLERQEVNVGLAHGISGLLKLCLMCYKRGIASPIVKKMADDIIFFLVKIANAGSTGVYFPTIAYLDDRESNVYSRLGWCYGDLMNGYVMLQAAELFCDPELRALSVRILRQSTFRTEYLNTSVMDAGFCHGCAGIAHVYNRIASITGMQEFHEAAKYWIQRTLAFKVGNTGGSFYKRFDGKEKMYVDDFGLLEGDSGVGLVLLSYLTGDFSWDYALLVNEI